MISPTPSPVTIAPKPCPFCGGTPKVFQREHPAIQRVTLAWIVQCSGCTAETCSEHRQWAIDYWNRRHHAGEDVKASPVVPVEKMQKLYDELHEDAKHMYPTDESLDNGCPMTVDEGEAWAFGIARSRIAQLIKEAKGG